MAPANTKAFIVGVVVLLIAILAGGLAWRQTHPTGASSVAALMSALPVPPCCAKTPPATPARPGTVAPPAHPSATAADRGPEPPTGADPETAAAAAPSFDIVRVERSGDAVVAGKGKPGADEELVAGGKVVAQAKADANGQFVFTPPPLKPGAYDLSLRQSAKGQAQQDSKQAVAVAVPEQGKGEVVVALAEPGKPTKVLAAPAPASPPAAPKTGSAATPVAIGSVELENGSGLFASGKAAPGSRLRVYLNGSHVADATADAAGAWTLRVRRGLAGGDYKVRVDAVGADGKVVERAEVPFAVPVAVATAAPAPAAAQSTSRPPTESTAAPSPSPPSANQASAPAPAPAAAASAPSNAVVDKVETATVVPGDNLWDISRTRLGDPTRYTRIYTANAAQIRDPNLIYPGQVFVMPHD